MTRPSDRITASHPLRTLRFITQCDFSQVCNIRTYKEVRFIKYNTTRWAIQLLFGKGQSGYRPDDFAWQAISWSGP